MYLKGIVLGEISQRKTNTVITYTQKLKNKTDSQRELVINSGEKEAGRGKIVIENEEIQNTNTMYKTNNKDILYSTRNYSHYFITSNRV